MTSEKEEEKMSLAEREQWLKERGVQIENLVSDRERNKQGNDNDNGFPSILEQMAGMGITSNNDDKNNVDEKNNVRFISFVCIPQDDNKAMRTLKVPIPLQGGGAGDSARQQLGGDAIPEYVRKYFASDSKSIDVHLLKDQATKHFAGGQLEGLAKTNISASAMSAVAAQGQVETFVLVHPADTNQYQGVYVYLDEVGLLKKLPHNKRASQIASACGYHPPPNFYGDVFVGRVQTKPIMHNVDFVAGVDTDWNTSTWMKRAVSENLTWQQEMNRIKGGTSSSNAPTQPAMAGTDGVAAKEELFTWTQDDDEIEITVDFSSTSTTAESSSFKIQKSKIKVTFLPKSIKVKYDKDEYVAISLYSSIDVDGCTWTIDENNLIITCEKATTDEIWPRISR